jgi:hypothetical protein
MSLPYLYLLDENGVNANLLQIVRAFTYNPSLLLFLAKFCIENATENTPAATAPSAKAMAHPHVPMQLPLHKRRAPAKEI